ncbi:MAG: SCO family protein [Chloroflexota bacterium]
MAVVLVVAVAGVIFGLRRQAQPGLTGGVFSDMPPAPDFSLRDQNGQTVTMSQLKGKVVALTFLYTHCPDVCPLMASQLAAADQRLGADAKNVEIVSVSVDPVGDTLPSVKKFTEDHNLAGQANWHYLMGSPGQLQPVWEAYHVGSSATSEGAIQGVDHSALVYLTDTTGRLRVILSSNFTVSDFVQDAQALLKGR